MAMLTWDSPHFLSVGDELLVFEWMRRIKAIRSWKGVAGEVYIRVRRPVSHTDLRELLALFFKYDIEMTQLAQFRTDRNAEWFCSPKTYWYDRVFLKRVTRRRSSARQSDRRGQGRTRGHR
jgi:hypothetical protein